MVTMVPFYFLLPDVGKFVLCSVVIAYLYVFLNLVETIVQVLLVEINQYIKITKLLHVNKRINFKNEDFKSVTAEKQTGFFIPNTTESN